jgi:succinate dehydrogenase / fumarate reductase iron-sulfur subunit
MAEFTLPRNSKVHEGKAWPKPEGKRLKDFKIYSWNPYGRDKKTVILNYRPVHDFTMSSDIDYIKPNPRVY